MLAQGSTRAAAHVTALNTETALDGDTYVHAELDPPPNSLTGVPLAGLTITVVTQQASANPFDASASLSGSSASITLDRVYPQLHAGDAAVVDTAGQLIAATVASTALVMVPVPVTTPSPAQLLIRHAVVLEQPQPAAPATRVSLTLATAPPAGWQDHFQLRFGALDGGKPTASAKTRIANDDLGAAAALAGPVEPLGNAPSPTSVLAQGAEAAGAEIPGSISVDDAGNGIFHAAGSAPPFDPLRTPVDLFGNVLDATRGETVGNEILGSADASQAFQSFTLKKKPLTYVLDPSAPDRIRAALQVRVNGTPWDEVPSFFGAKPIDEVYILRADPDGTPRITFGDGVRGARPASGVGNVTATYRFGAGAAKPPAGTITQIARPVKGLGSVVNPLPARGGADAESGAACALRRRAAR